MHTAFEEAQQRHEPRGRRVAQAIAKFINSKQQSISNELDSDTDDDEEFGGDSLLRVRGDEP